MRVVDARHGHEYSTSWVQSTQAVKASDIDSERTLVRVRVQHTIEYIRGRGLEAGNHSLLERICRLAWILSNECRSPCSRALFRLSPESQPRRAALWSIRKVLGFARR